MGNARTEKGQSKTYFRWLTFHVNKHDEKNHTLAMYMKHKMIF